MSAKKLLKEAIQSLGQKDYDTALQKTQQAIDSGKLKNAYQAWLLHGKSLFCVKRFADAEKSYRTALTLEEGGADAWKGLHELYSSSNEFSDDVKAEALQALLVYMDRSKKKWSAYKQQLASYREQSGDVAAALRLLEEVVFDGSKLVDETPNTAQCLERTIMLSIQLDDKRSDAEADEKTDREHSTQDLVLARLPMAACPAWVHACAALCAQQPAEQILHACRSLRPTMPEDCTARQQRLLLDAWKKLLLVSLRWNGGLATTASTAIVAQLILEHDFTCGVAHIALGVSNLVTSLPSSEDVFLGFVNGAGDDEEGRGHLERALLGTAIPGTAEEERIKKATFASDKVCANSDADAVRTSSLAYAIGWSWLTICHARRRDPRQCISMLKTSLSVARTINTGMDGMQDVLLANKLTLAYAYQLQGGTWMARATNSYAALREKLQEDDVWYLRVLKAQTLLFHSLDQWSETEQCCDALLALDASDRRALCLKGWCRQHQGDAPGALHLLQKAVAMAEEAGVCSSDGELFLRLGAVLWRLGGEHRDECEPLFKRSATLSPGAAEPFAFLGHVYRVAGQEIKSKRCYLKALQLDATCREAGVALVTLRMRGGHVASSEALLRKAVNAGKGKGVGWAEMRLGLLLLEQGKFLEAVEHVQVAIRVCPSDGQLWLALAEAYMGAGRWSGCIKCAEKCLELQPDNARCRYVLSQALSTVGMRELACVHLEQLVQEQSHFLPGVQLYGQVLQSQCRELMQNGALDTAAAKMQQVVAVLRRCLDEHGTSPHTVRLHKTLGDVLCLASQLPQRESEDEPRQWVASHIEHLQAADRSYAAALTALSQRERSRARDESEAYLHYDRAVTSFKCSGFAERLLEGGEEQASTHRQQAVQHLYNALLLLPSEAVLWNALGVVHPDAMVKQHCFIRSVELDPRGSPAWDNIGLLYLRVGLRDLSRAALKTSQALDPTKPDLWLAQGMFNQTVYSFEAYLQAKASFARALELEPSLTARLGLGHTAYSVGDFQQAEFALRKYVQQDPLNVASHNLLALVYELRKEQPQLAVLHLRHALRLLDLVCTPVGRDKKDIRAMLHINLARVLCQMRRFIEAAAVYEKLDAGKCTPVVLRGMACAHFGKGDAAAAEACLHRAIEHAQKRQKGREHLACVMALCRLYFSSGRQRLAISSLQAMSEDHPSAALLLSLFSAHVQCGDAEGAGRVLGRMREADSKDDRPLAQRLTHKRELCVLGCHVSLMKKDVPGALQCLQQAVDLCPEDVELHNLRAHLTLQYQSGQCKEVLDIARLPLHTSLDMGEATGHPSHGAWHVQRNQCVVAALLTAGEVQRAVYLAQRLCHMAPGDVAGRVLLAAALTQLALLEPDATSVHQALEACSLALKLLPEAPEKMEQQRLMLSLSCVELRLVQDPSIEVDVPGDTPAALLLRLHARKASLLGDTATATWRYQEALRKAPGMAVLWEELCEVYAASGALSAARHVLETSLGFAENTADTHARLRLRLARLLFFTKQYRPALETVDALLAQPCPSSCAASAHLLRGVFLRKSRKFAAALEAFQDCVQASSGSSSPLLHFHTSLALCKQKQPDVPGATREVELALQGVARGRPAALFHTGCLLQAARVAVQGGEDGREWTDTAKDTCPGGMVDAFDAVREKALKGK